MLPYFNEILYNIYELLRTAINLLNQLVSLYGEQNNKHYHTSYKFYTFDLPFDYLGKILSYFLAIDSIVSGNEFLLDNWDKYRYKYRYMIHQCKSNSSEFNMNDQQKKNLGKLIKKLTATIFERTCYKQSLRIIIEKSGEISQTGAGIKPIQQCPVFLHHFTRYITSKIKTIYSNLDQLTESYEPIQLFQYLSLFGLYLKLCGKNNNGTILEEVWNFQRKIVSIHLVGISYFNIENFLNNFNEFKGINRNPDNVAKHVKSELSTLVKQIPFIINNYNYKILSWTTKIDSLFNDSNTFSKNKHSNIESLIDNGNKKAKLVLKGLFYANYLRKTVSNILETHLNYGISLSQELINSLISGIELVKVVESEFTKLMHFIGLNLNIINRALLVPIQDIIKKVEEKAQKKYRDGISSNLQLYKDALFATSIIFNCSQAVQSELRLVIEKLCLSTINVQEMLEEENYELININLWKLELINQLSREIRRCCDCSFLYLYQDIFPTAFKIIYNDRPKRLYFFMIAINDIEKPLYYIKYKENNGIDLIKLLRKKTFEIFEGCFLKKLSKEIEDDLRSQIHDIFIEGLEPQSYSDVNLNSCLKIKNFKLFDKIIDIKRYIEEELNMNFYKLTTLNLDYWEIYQQMRALAKFKYGLNLHEVYLPCHHFEQGKDILEIIRNFKKFTKNYIHNMHSQIFIEMPNESSYTNIIGVPQIKYSIYKHGKGIINSIINKLFLYISKTIKVLLEIIFLNDYIILLLKDEKSFWEANKARIKYNYPLTKGKGLLEIFLDEDKKNNFLTKSIRCITQIGDAVALVRCIRTAVTDYNSQNLNLLTSYNLSDFNNLIHQISLQVESHISLNILSNTQELLNDSNQIFCETINSLKQTREKELNYLELLVIAFGGCLYPDKIPDIDLFAFLLPPFFLSFIDNVNEKISNFSDDGFMMGVCYLLKIFNTEEKFESLNWFPSVIAEYKKECAQVKSSKDIKDMSIRQITYYLEQIELQYFTYTSASFLFTELDKLYKSRYLKLNEQDKNDKSRLLKLNKLNKYLIF